MSNAKDRLLRITQGIMDADPEVHEVEWDLTSSGEPRLSIRFHDGEEVQFLLVREDHQQLLAKSSGNAPPGE